MKIGPVVGMDHPSAGRVDGFKFPPPQMSDGWFVGLGWFPCDLAPFAELDNMVLEDRSAGNGETRDSEDLADGANSLVAACGFDVVVSVPVRVPRRVSNQLEDPFGWRSDQQFG